MSLTKLPLGRNNSVMTSLFPPRESLVVTSRLGTGNSRSFFLRCTSRFLLIDCSTLHAQAGTFKQRLVSFFRRTASLQYFIILGSNPKRSVSSMYCIYQDLCCSLQCDERIIISNSVCLLYDGRMSGLWGRPVMYICIVKTRESITSSTQLQQQLPYLTVPQQHE
jgi:hypothetical protein